MRDHIKILGILNIVMGSLTALLGLGILLLMGTIAGIITASAASISGTDLENARIAPAIIAFVGLGIGIFFLLLSAPSIIGGWGLLNYKPWSRLLMIIVSGFHLLHVPLGTALGVYGLWVLLNEQTRQLLESRGALPAMAVAYSQQPGAFQPGFPTQQPPNSV